MEKFQKFPNTTGQFVKVQDHSKLDSTSSTSDETKLDVALKHAVERVDYNSNTQSLAFSGSTFSKQILVIGTDGNQYLIPAFLWEKPSAPTVVVLNYDRNPSSGYTKTVTNTNQAMTIKIAKSGDGKIFYKIDNGTETAFPSNGQLTVTPDMRSHCQTKVVTIYEKYAGQVSDETTVTLNYWRKLDLTLTYTPDSTNGENGGTAHSTMYYSPSGMVIASTNQSIAGDTREPVWTNDQGTNENRMIFYTDISANAYGFQASLDDSSADANDGWETSDKKFSKALQIRHLHIPVATAVNPQINNVSGDAKGKYEPYKNLVISATESRNTNGSAVTLSTSYQIVYSHNIFNPGSNQINVNVINEAINATHTRIYGDVTVTGRIDALVPETINGTDYYWAGQAFSDVVTECRHLPKPSIEQDLPSTPNESGNWVSGVKFTMSAPDHLVDSDGETAVSENIVYTSGSSTTEREYTAPIILSGDSYITQTVAKNTFKAKRKVATWITSEQVSAPSESVVYDKPEVYYGVWNASELGYIKTNNKFPDFFVNPLDDDKIKTALGKSVVKRYNLEKATSTSEPLLFAGNKKKLDNGIGHIVAYPSSWGEITYIDNGAIPYSDFNTKTITLKGVNYRVYYKANVNGGQAEEGISFYFNKQ